MARYKKPYSLWLRKIRPGLSVFYAKVWDQRDKRITISTGQTDRDKAVAWCERQLAAGRLIPDRMLTLQEWAIKRYWWEWGACLYTQARLKRSPTGKPAIAKRHVEKCRYILHHKILPYHGRLKLDKITVADCEKLLFEWAGKHSHKTANHFRSVYAVMLTEAVRLEILPANPWDRVPRLAVDSQRRGILTLAEARRLLDRTTVETVWKGHWVYYFASLVAATTGLRQGEVLGLRRENLFPDHLHVEYSWSERYGLLPTKTKRTDDLPIPRMLHTLLSREIDWDGYLFSTSGGERPTTANNAVNALYSAMRRIGITDSERRERGIVFHSWRAFFVTNLIGAGVSRAVAMSVARHKTESISEHYTALGTEHFEEVRRVQSALLERTGNVVPG